MHMSVQTVLHTLRFFVGDCSRPSSLSRTSGQQSGAGSCRAAALSVVLVASTAMGSCVGVGWDSIFPLFTATRF